MTNATRRKRREGADPALFVLAHLELAAVCRELRRRRLAAGLGQSEVAAALGIDIATLSIWENCHCPPLTLNLFAWAAYFGVTLAVVVTPEEE